MPCFYCGKRVSLVRQLTDADFCSDDHRKRYRALTRTALNRLLETGQQTADPSQDLSAPFSALPTYVEGPEVAPPTPRYDEAAPLERPAPAKQPRRPRQLGAPHPVFAMPAAPAPAAPPPEANFFLELPLRPSLAGSFRHSTDLEAAEPDFDGQAEAPPGESPAESPRLRGNSLHGGELHMGALRAAPQLRARAAERLPMVSTVPVRLRPATVPADRKPSLPAPGRAEPRPVLGRVPASYVAIAGMGRGELICRPETALNRRSGCRAAADAFLDCPRETEILRFARRPARNALRQPAPRPQSVAPAKAALGNVLEPALAFHPAPAQVLEMPWRPTSAPRLGSHWVGAFPQPVLCRLRPLEVPLRVVAPQVVLPEPVIGVLVKEAPAAMRAVETWAILSPRVVAALAARRAAPFGEFAPSAASLPRFLLASGAVSGLPGTGLEFLGYPAAVRSWRARPLSPALDFTLRPSVEVSLPGLLVRRGVQGVASAASWMEWAMLPLRPPAAASAPAFEAPLLRAACWYPRAPEAAVPSRSLAGPGFECSPASRPVRSRTAAPLALGAQQRVAGGLVELPPRLPVQRWERQLTTPKPMPPQAARILARRSAPQMAMPVAFPIQARAPVSAVRGQAHLEKAPYAAAPPPRTMRGVRAPAPAEFGFTFQPAAIPGLGATATGARLRASEAALSHPTPVAGMLPGALLATPPAIAVSSTFSIEGLMLPPPARRTALDACGLREAELPSARKLVSAIEPAPQAPIVAHAFFPRSPTPVSGTHGLPHSAHVGLAAAAAAGRKSRASGPALCAVPAPQPRLLEPPRTLAWTAVLSEARPLAVRIASLAGAKRTWSSDWQRLGAAAPVVHGTVELLRLGRLAAARIEAASYLEPARRAPAPAAPVASQRAFAAHPAKRPAKHRIIARERLDEMPAIPSPPRPPRPAPAAPRALAVGFAEQESRVPDLRAAEAPLLRQLEARRLGLCPVGAGVQPRMQAIPEMHRASMATAPVPLTCEIERAAGRVPPLRRFLLGSAGLDRLAQLGARNLAGRAHGARRVEIAAAAPIEPASAPLGARHWLGASPAIARSGRALAGALQTTPAAIVAVSTHPAELPAARRPAIDRSLAPASPFRLRNQARQRTSARTHEGWQALGQESGALRFETAATRALGVRWPTATSFRFQHGRRPAAKSGTSVHVDPRAVVGFAAPALARPQSAGYMPILSIRRLSKLAASRSRNDARTAGRASHLAPMFRPAARPSRLPVFHTQLEKAHMPAGRSFYGFDLEDHDDHATAAIGSAYPAPLREPVPASAAFAVRSRRNLCLALFEPVVGGLHTGAPRAASGWGGFPFVQELCFIDAGIELLGMDFEAIAETHEPRWRSALKTASGFFRGVVLLIPGIVVLSASLTACSASGGSFRQSIQSRAAIHIEHDFASGLQGWYGARDWAKNWSRDPRGFVHVGQLALYRPSLELTDYRLEFLVQIDGQGVGWVYRAADLQNYYATKLIVVAPGPPRRVALLRYQMVGGQAVQPLRIPLRIGLHNGRPYRIRQDVVGTDFTTSIEDEVIDFWTDDRLRSGGVGFFGDREDRPLLYWMKVTYHDDFWGKICGMMAPGS